MVEVASVVGLPQAVDGKLYNCAALAPESRVQAFAPRTSGPVPTEPPHAMSTRAPPKTPQPSTTPEPTRHPDTPEAAGTPDHYYGRVAYKPMCWCQPTVPSAPFGDGPYRVQNANGRRPTRLSDLNVAMSHRIVNQAGGTHER
jgi:hypothetical protein